MKQDDVTELCLASSTRPRRRNLLAALAQYTVSHFRSSSTKSSSWFLSSLMKKTHHIMMNNHITKLWLSIFWGNKDGPTACFTLLPREVFNHYHYCLEHKYRGCYLTHNHSHPRARSCSIQNIHIHSHNAE